MAASPASLARVATNGTVSLALLLAQIRKVIMSSTTGAMTNFRISRFPKMPHHFSKVADAELGGFDWQAEPMQSGEIANFAMSPTDPNTIYMGVEVNAHSMYKSVDGGRTWRRVDFGDHAKDVAIHPTDPDVAFYSDSQSVRRTTDGERFSQVLENDSPAGPSETSFSTIAIAPGDPSVVYAAVKGGASGPFGPRTGGRLFRSSDGGGSFRELGSDLPVLNVLIVDPRDEDRLLAGSSDGVYHSSDGGRSFARVYRAIGVVSLHTWDGETILAGSENGVLRSADGGRSWHSSSEGLPSSTVLRVRIVRDFPNIVWATTPAGVARSSDGGR
ncbi:MAG: hypothetical protein IH950_16455, partial [Bacteroidetes bacterium]|nr:hypothetical protein [Bacteroidota bacterium]